jgi:K+-transporting ATPase c subunit
MTERLIHVDWEGPHPLKEPTDIDALVAQHVTGRVFGIFGEHRVNVLSLNLAMERI